MTNFNFLIDVTSSICGVPSKLVFNLNTLYGALASGFNVDANKFEALCRETEQIYFDENDGVGWYSLPPSLHRLFKHAADVIRASPLPVGILTEEASEANNKNLRRFRLQHSRRSSWFNNIMDVFNRMMDISDPIIQDTSAARRASRRRKRRLPKEVLAVLKNPDFSNELDSSQAEESDNSDISD